MANDCSDVKVEEERNLFLWLALKLLPLVVEVVKAVLLVQEIDVVLDEGGGANPVNLAVQRPCVGIVVEVDKSDVLAEWGFPFVPALCLCLAVSLDLFLVREHLHIPWAVNPDFKGLFATEDFQRVLFLHNEGVCLYLVSVYVDFHRFWRFMSQKYILFLKRKRL